MKQLPTRRPGRAASWNHEPTRPPSSRMQTIPIWTDRPTTDLAVWLEYVMVPAALTAAGFIEQTQAMKLASRLSRPALLSSVLRTLENGRGFGRQADPLAEALAALGPVLGPAVQYIGHLYPLGPRRQYRAVLLAASSLSFRPDFAGCVEVLRLPESTIAWVAISSAPLTSAATRIGA